MLVVRWGQVLVLYYINACMLEMHLQLTCMLAIVYMLA